MMPLSFRLVLWLAVVPCVFAWTTRAAEPKPNFVFLFADDMAYDTLDGRGDDGDGMEGISLPVPYLAEYPHKDAIGCGPGLRDERLAPFPRTEFALRTHRREYHALITHLDAQIGRILDALAKSGMADNTYVIFTADHGLACGHHGLLGKQNMYDHSVRVPWMISGPGIPAGMTIDSPIYLQDILPTTLELAGIEKPDHVEFHSVMPVIRGASTGSYGAMYGAYFDLQRMVALDGHKLILYPRARVARLYDLDADPLETKDLAADPGSASVMRKLFARFRVLQAETGDALDLTKAFPDLL